MSWEQRNAVFCNAQTDAQMAYIEAEREVNRLEAEYASLRMRITSLDAALEGMHLIREQDKADNERLRKLVQRMWPAFTGEKRATFADRLHVRAEIDELEITVTDESRASASE
ncbi:MAG: hypothetical protein IKE22_07065 [Atopobiaceae bacterium]|nr:hypothetical protein [Atopobiaceae bacterium]